MLSIFSIVDVDQSKNLKNKKIQKSKAVSRKLMFDNFFDIITLIILLRILMPQKSRKLRQLKAEIKRKKYWIETKNNGRKLNQYKIRELLD